MNPDTTNCSDAPKRRSHVARNVLIVLLFVLCFVAVRSVLLDFRETHQAGDLYLNYHHGRVVPDATPTTLGEIEPWMTLSYVNFLFHLPTEYLANALHISARRYPNVQITRYARMHNLDLSQFLGSVQQAVGQYRAQ